MKKAQRPPQIEKLIDKIVHCLETGNYIQSRHAIDRQNERGIDLPDAIYVLKNGYHEKAKTTFDEARNNWRYAIRHKLEGVDIRVIVAFDGDIMGIITVMPVKKL